jgi:hypothetical protein
MERFLGFHYEIDGSHSIDVDTMQPIETNPPERAAAFERAVLGLLNTIDSDSSVGGVLLRGVALGQRIVIGPGTKLVATMNQRHPADGMALGWKYGKLRGTGRGTDGLVLINPNDLAMTNGAAGQRDAVLLHEIVHAIRVTHGLLHKRPMMRYCDSEEYLAVMLTNIYVSSKYPLAPLRGDHAAYPLHNPVYRDKKMAIISTSGLDERRLYYYVLGYQAELVKLINEMETLTAQLKEAKCKFNPLRVCYNGYDPQVEEADRPPDQRRKQGYPPLVDKEPFANALREIMRTGKPMPEMFSDSLTDRLF